MALEADKDWWKTLFDDLYLVTDSRSVCDNDITCQEVSLLLQMLPIDKKHRILDLCGGHGRHSLELSSRGYTDITVLDFSTHLIRTGEASAAVKRLPVTFLQADARNTGLPESHFDHVLILGNSLGYLQGQDDDLTIIREAARVLKPGGYLLIDCVSGKDLNSFFNPNAWHEIGHEIVVCRQREKAGTRVTTREMVIHKDQGLIRDQTFSIRLYMPDELARLVGTAGFTDVKAHTDFSWYRGNGDCGMMDHRMLVTGRLK